MAKSTKKGGKGSKSIDEAYKYLHYQSMKNFDAEIMKAYKEIKKNENAKN